MVMVLKITMAMIGVKDHGNGGGGDVSSGDNGGDVKDHGEGKAKVRRKECSQG